MKRWLGTVGPLLWVVGALGCSSDKAKESPPTLGPPPEQTTAHLLVIGTTGYMQDAALGVEGAWYSYGDAVGSAADAAAGDCQAAGHLTSECSAIATPMLGSFENSGGAMHTEGTVEKVLDIVGMAGSPDYDKMWGAGIGCDLNNPGNADGGVDMKSPYDAPAHHVVGISFDFDTPDHTLPSTGLRVEFPTPTTQTAAHVWRPAGSGDNYVSPIAIGTNEILFASDVEQPDYVMNKVDFNSAQVLSVQWHVPTTVTAGASYSFTIQNFSLLTLP
ncbi:MAG TPA: hypothetical protein VGI10_03455 [Polyangiaceae bacterium]|jgi:hypothetical protein